MLLTKNFTLSEFACKDGTAVPAELISNAQQLANNLQVKAGRRVTLSIDSRFFDSIRGRKVNVRIVYYATGAVMRLNNNAGTFGALLNNWHETVIPSLVLAAPSLEISVNSGTAIFHMVEVIK